MKKLIWVFLIVCVCPAWGDPTITVNSAGLSPNPVYSRLFGHNLSYIRQPYSPAYTPAKGLWAWDVTSTNPIWGPKPAIIPIVQPGTGDDALIRFPAGDSSDVYHFRRGVGWPLMQDGVAGVRRFDPNPYDSSGATSYGNEFGTDELMAFIATTCPNAKPLITVNWWDWNRPERSDPNKPQWYIPDAIQKGIQEAANWVAYCNGRVDVPSGTYNTVLLRAAAEGWAPSRFVDPGHAYDTSPPLPMYDSTSATAAEWADSNYAANPTCWRSWEAAPTGYFAWLRRYNIWKRPAAYGGKGEALYGGQPLWTNLNQWPDEPYNIQYWEIGNEPHLKWRSGDYKAFAQMYCNSVNSYSTAMKVVDSTIKIGASLEDRANLSDWDPRANPQYTPTDHLYTSGTLIPLDSEDLDAWPDAGPGNWDTLLLNQTGGNINFVTLHPYTHAIGADVRYSWATWLPEDPPSDTVAPIIPMRYRALTLQAGQTYTFRVRAKGTPNKDNPPVYPSFRLYLIPGLDNSTNPNTSELGTIVSGPVTANYTEYGKAAFTKCVYDNVNGWKNWDYDFVITPVTTGTYIPWVKRDPGANGYPLEVRQIYYNNGTVLDTQYPSDATLVEMRTAEDQATSSVASTIILGRRLAQMNNYLTTYFPNLEFGCTEFGYYYGLTARGDQMRMLKSVIGNADLYKEMMENGVDFACYSGIHDWYFNVVQNKGTYDFIQEWEPNQNLNQFFPSAFANLRTLLAGHWGSNLLSSPTVTSAKFDSPAYYGVIEMPGIDYLSALASGDDYDLSNQWYSKVYVMVINRDWVNPTTPTTVSVGPSADHSMVTAYTLKCWDTGCTGLNALDAQNEFANNRIDFKASAVTSGVDYAGGTTTITHVFPANSITVIEVSAGQPVGSLFSKADGPPTVAVQNKYVTAAFSDRIYIEEPDRTSGIAVLCANPNDYLDKRVNVTGKMVGSGGPERAVKTTSGDGVVTIAGVIPDGREIKPFGMRNQWVGGKSPHTNTPQVKYGFGFFNTGLLVQTWGKVTEDHSPDYFCINDGSNYPNQAGLRVLSELPSPLHVGSYVAVTGISSAFESGTDSLSAIRPTIQVALAPQYQLCTIEHQPLYFSLAGIPYDPNPEAVFYPCTTGQTININGFLDRWDSQYQTWVTYEACTPSVFGKCLAGEGYQGPDFECFRYLRIPLGTGTLDNDQVISLPGKDIPSGRFAIVGPPVGGDFWQMYVTDGNSTQLLSPGAYDQPWITEIDVWDEASSTWKIVDTLNDSMLVGKAYRVYYTDKNLALVIPYLTSR